MYKIKIKSHTSTSEIYCSRKLYYFIEKRVEYVSRQVYINLINYNIINGFFLKIKKKKYEKIFFKYIFTINK